MEETKKESQTHKDNVIELSELTNHLTRAIAKIKERGSIDEYSKLTVSQTVSFLALVYEKVRNAIEYREDHLIRRAAIERILKRRLSLNPNGKNEAENVLRELMWARYFPNGSLGQTDIHYVQKIIDSFIDVRKKILVGRNYKHRQYLSNYLFELFTD